MPNIRKKGIGALIGAALLGVTATLSSGGMFKADILPSGTATLFADNTSGSPLYAESGTWSDATGGYGNLQRTAAGTKKSATARVLWTFRNLTPGTYEIWTTWTPPQEPKTAASDAVYTVRALKQRTVTVNQRRSPQSPANASTLYAGLPWESLGTYEVRDTASVELANLANGAVYADAVLLKYIPPPSADLFATAKAGQDLTKPGTAVTFLAGIGNNGPVAATDAAVRIRFSPGLLAPRKQPDSRCTGSLAGNEVLCLPRKLENGEQKEFQVSAQVQKDTECGLTLVAEATVSSGKPRDLRADNDTATAGVSVRCGELADLSVALAADVSGTSPSGRLVLYTVTLTNNGPDAMSKDALLSIQKLTDDTQDYKSYSGEMTPNCTGDSCWFPAGLAAGQSASLTFIGSFEDSDGDCGKTSMTKVALLPVIEQTGDPLNSNNEATAGVAVECNETSDIAVTMQAASETASRSGAMSYNIEVKNSGPDSARNLQILAKPSTASWFSYDNLDPRCRRLGVSEYVMCTLDSLDTNQTVDINLEMLVSESADCSVELATEAKVKATPWDREHRDDNQSEARIRCE